MPFSEPGWWYQEKPSRAARLLVPVAGVWGAAARWRYRHGEGFRADVPVVCVGNFTAGGTGKTPISLLIADELKRLGCRPAFLTRGYGGRVQGPHWVMPARDTAADVGDEPLLLAREAPTMIARDRARGARAISASEARFDAIVMDDGLQNGSLAKSLVIAVVDGRRGIGNGLVMPAGPLRAPLDFQLSLVDAVIVNAADGAREAHSEFVNWLRSHFNGPVIAATTQPAAGTEWIAGERILAFSGIGAPERFFRLIERLGGQLVGRRSFGDHHVFTDVEARDLLAEAKAHGAALCTTEKDWVRLQDDGAPAALRAAARTLPIRIEIEDRSRVRLTELIRASLALGRSAGL